jgi:hypothetical protein
MVQTCCLLVQILCNESLARPLSILDVLCGNRGRSDVFNHDGILVSIAELSCYEVQVVRSSEISR